MRKIISKKRKSNIELLRVISMLMVMMLHALGHGGILSAYKNMEGLGYYLFWLLFAFSRVAVNCFVLISGYLMIESKFRFSRIVNLIIQVEFYSVFCSLIIKFVFHKPLGIKDLVFMIFPLTSGRYWFMTCYAILLLSAPLLNKVILSMNRSTLLKTNLFLVVLFSVIPTVLYWSRSTLGNGYTFVWFIVLYFTGAYIKLYKVFTKKEHYFTLYFAFCIIGYLLHIVVKNILGIFDFYVKEETFYTSNNILFFLAVLFFFLAFLQLDIRKKFWDRAAKLGIYSLGAYLCSDHEIIRSSVWYSAKLDEAAKQGLIVVLLYLFCIVLIIFLTGCFTEWCRIYFMQCIKFSKGLDFLDKKFEILEERINKKIKNIAT